MWFTLCSGISEPVYQNNRTALYCKVRLPNFPSTGTLLNISPVPCYTDTKDHHTAAFFAKFTVHTSHRGEVAVLIYRPHPLIYCWKFLA